MRVPALGLFAAAAGVSVAAALLSVGVLRGGLTSRGPGAAERELAALRGEVAELRRELGEARGAPQPAGGGAEEALARLREETRVALEGVRSKITHLTDETRASTGDVFAELLRLRKDAERAGDSLSALKGEVQRAVAELRDEEAIRSSAVAGLQKQMRERRIAGAGGAGAEAAVRQGVHYEADYAVPGSPADARYDDSVPGAVLRYPVGALGSEDSRLRFALLSNRPKVFYFPSFLSLAECDELVQIASRSMFRSEVVPYTKDKDQQTTHDARTSMQGIVPSAAPVSERVVARIAKATGFNVTQVIGLDQVLRYEVGQRYESHYDYFDPKFYGPRPKNRAVTVFLYLSDVEEGGETVFLRANGGRPVWDYKACDKGLRVKARKGAAVIFYDMRPDGSLDEWSLHGGCVVRKGVKFAGTVWITV